MYVTQFEDSTLYYYVPSELNVRAHKSRASMNDFGRPEGNESEIGDNAALGRLRTWAAKEVQIGRFVSDIVVQRTGVWADYTLIVKLRRLGIGEGWTERDIRAALFSVDVSASLGETMWIEEINDRRWFHSVSLNSEAWMSEYVADAYYTHIAGDVFLEVVGRYQRKVRRSRRRLQNRRAVTDGFVRSLRLVQGDKER